MCLGENSRAVFEFFVHMMSNKLVTVENGKTNDKKRRE